MSLNVRYYELSNRFSVVGLLAVMFSTAVMGIILAVPYLFLIRVCPIIYLCILITLGYGYILGMISSKLCKVFKIRNKKLAIFGICIGIVIYTYFKWIFYTGFQFSDDYSYFSMFTYFLSSPSELWAGIRVINYAGIWSLSGSTPVTGIILWIVWLVEIGLLSAATIHITVNQVEKPFIEAEND